MYDDQGLFEEPTQFWKNFRLGSELQVSGAFLYNGLYSLEIMKSFYWEADCFEFLYNISVGVERLAKIAIILIEHDKIERLDNQAQELFEKSLITHNHPDLIGRITKQRKLTLGKAHNRFINLLGNFYHTYRYDRYSISSVFKPNMDKEELIDYIKASLKIDISNEPLSITPVDNRIRAFVGRVVQKIVKQLYGIIVNEASRLQIYTSEIAIDSKAFKIFVADEYDFIGKRVAQREVLIYLLKSNPTGAMMKYIENLEPLELGDLSINEYIQGMLNIHSDRNVRDDVDQRLEDREFTKARRDAVLFIGSSDADHLEEEEDDLY